MNKKKNNSNNKKQKIFPIFQRLRKGTIKKTLLYGDVEQRWYHNEIVIFLDFPYDDMMGNNTRTELIFLICKSPSVEFTGDGR